MSSTGQDSIYNRNDINLIFTFEDDVILCKTLDNFKLRLKNIEELEDYLEKDEDLIQRSLIIDSIELEQNYLIRIIAGYSKYFNNGIIDWNYHYPDLPFRRMKKIIGNNPPITLIVRAHPDSVGGTGALPIKLSPSDYVEKGYNMIKWILKRINAKKNAYNCLKKRYNHEKDFVQKVIKTEYEWKKGFIEKSFDKDNELFEKTIMKDCNYRYNKLEDMWQRKGEKVRPRRMNMFNTKKQNESLEKEDNKTPGVG